MAVTVEEVPSVVLDEAYRIVETNEAASPWFGQHLGEDVFDVFPGSRELFRPYYEEARRTGEVVAFTQYYGGYVTHVTAEPRRNQLAVSWRTLSILDTWTLDGLRASLDAALQGLDELSSGLERRRVRQSLHVVGGGA